MDYVVGSPKKERIPFNQPFPETYVVTYVQNLRVKVQGRIWKHKWMSSFDRPRPLNQDSHEATTWKPPCSALSTCLSVRMVTLHLITAVRWKGRRFIVFFLHARVACFIEWKFFRESTYILIHSPQCRKGNTKIYRGGTQWFCSQTVRHTRSQKEDIDWFSLDR